MPLINILIKKLYCLTTSRIFFWILLTGVVSACSTLQSSHNEFINELIIRNETSDTIQNVTLKVPKTNTILTTNFILPKREYSLGFQTLENKREVATLTWEYRSITYRQEIKPVISANIKENDPAIVIIRIRENGWMQSTIEPR